MQIQIRLAWPEAQSLLASPFLRLLPGSPRAHVPSCLEFGAECAHLNLFCIYVFFLIIKLIDILV